MNIGEIAEQSGITAKMIRYYESVGLIPPAHRTAAGYRTYGQEDLKVLLFIKRLRALDFSVKQMDAMLALWRNPSRSSADVKALALSHSEALEEKAEQLLSMSKALRKLAGECHGNEQPECAILNGLTGTPVV